MESSASAGRVASAVLVLHDLYGVTFTDIAATVGRTPAAERCGQPRGPIGDRLTTAVVLTVVDELISRVDFMRAPAKLATAQPRSGQT